MPMSDKSEVLIFYIFCERVRIRSRKISHMLLALAKNLLRVDTLA